MKHIAAEENYSCKYLRGTQAINALMYGAKK